MGTREPIAIIGIGCRFPGNANSPSSLWDLLLDPPDLLSSIPDERFSVRGFYHRNGQYHGHTNVSKAYFLSGKGTHRQFDAQFFGISPAEANVMDPQVRILLETVFEALETAGQTIESLEGSNTAVYSGLMVSDYEHLMSRDEASMGKYHVTGTARSLMSNRISYFFDWHGPSMTIDTACSSSLFAVHQAVQQLRSGESRVVIATGSNLLLDPIGYVGESNLQMLSPEGRSRMWDADADGYARGEGVAAIVLKTLSAAEADGDTVHCIIRETAINQDGKTRGITTPSPSAQAKLIRDCYHRAGLNIDSPADRPQYFEAHGTGTPTGDPIEAEAISSAFFGSNHRENGPLFVGSIKTVIGHTEGTSGLAGILKACLALEHSTIPPNLLFNRLNPKIKPFYSSLSIPTSTIPWPSVPTNSVRRASVNSFGFGGANAHAILESYSPNASQDLIHHHNGPVFSPFIFSATSEISLGGGLEAFHEFLIAKGESINLRDLTFTLHSRRTRFPFAAAFSASTAGQLASKIRHAINLAKSSPGEHLGIRSRQVPDGSKPRILAVFTGQGAQWARMGAELVSRSASARSVLKKLEARLASLPPTDRPSWSLTEELQKDPSSSQIGVAALSQPLCTAIQILLVDVLNSTGINLTATVGHSSGEIAAAYAAGLISAEDAICIAYYRGLYAHLAQGPEAQAGAMMAVGTSLEDAQELLQEPEFEGRACIAAINSSTSITIAGDFDAIEELSIIFKDEKKFARVIKVDKAYHSHHMIPCSKSFLGSLRNLNIQPSSSPRCTWFSSVCEDDTTDLIDSLKYSYWNRNMLNPVLFMQAVERALTTNGSFDMAIEIGPHPALKEPVLQTIQEISGQKIPYTGLIRRNSDDLEALADGLGYISIHLGKDSVNFQGCEFFLSKALKPRMVHELPKYVWNHESEYWHESRYARAIRKRSDSVHELLGHLSPDSTDHEMRWRHLLIPKEIPWLKGHQLQNQIVFPAAGYLVTALEAAMVILKGASTKFIEVLDLKIRQPLIFDNEDSSVEIVFSLADIQRQNNSQIEAKFHFNGGTGKNGDALESLATGSILICLGEPSIAALPSRNARPSNLLPVKTEEFYNALAKLKYQYSGHFIALSGLERKLGAATGFITDVEDSQLIVHPAVLDAALQAVILAASAPEDGKLWSLHLPTGIRRVRVNPSLCIAVSSSDERLPFDAFQLSDSALLSGDVDIFRPESNNAMIQVEGLECLPLSQGTARDDKVVFSSTVWGLAIPNAQKVALDGLPTQQQYDLACLLERVACFYLRKLDQDIPLDHPSRYQGPYTSFFKFASHTLSKSYDWPFWKSEWENDTMETIAAICHGYEEVIDFRLLHALGQKLTDFIMNNLSAIEIGIVDGLLSQYYHEGLGMREHVTYLARIIKQIVHRSPRIQCLEIGAGTGSVTKAILKEVGQPFSSYTFTDISSGFFESAQAAVGNHADRMLFKTLDITKDPCIQGFEKNSYDLIVASMVLHATPSLAQTLKNVRSLLRPGGYLVALEVQGNAAARFGTTFGAFPGWWLGSDEGRVLSPCIDIVEWDDLLRKIGFSGCDTTTPDTDPFVHPQTVFVSQATDDRVDFLREPLVSSPKLFSSDTVIQDLVLLGGESMKTARLAAQLESLLRQYCNRIKRARSLSNLHSLGITSTTTVLCLSELDAPIFKNLTNSQWELLKLMLEKAGSILWITQGRRVSEPYSNMLVGLLRCAIFELPGREFQFLDIEAPENLDARTIGEALLRFKAVNFWKQDNIDQSIYFTNEPELVIEKGGQLIVPRLIEEQAMNDRYNSSRRSILHNTNIHDQVVSVLPTSGGYFLRQELHVPVEPQSASLRGRVTHSLLNPIRVAGQGRLFLSIGKFHESSTYFVALSSKNASAVIPETFFTPPVEIASGSEANFLYIVSLYCLASEILQSLDEGDRILVHEPDFEFITILRNQAQCKDINITFTTCGSNSIQSCLHIHPNAPGRTLQALEPTSINMFLDLSTTSESKSLAERIRSQLPIPCRYETVQTVFGGNSRVPSAVHIGKVHKRLKDAVTQASSALAGAVNLEPQRPIIRIGDISDKNHLLHPQSLINWTTEDRVLTRVQPVDSQLIFSGHKTYWLVGLTGSLGVSLCQWMIRHGARYVVLSSRSPKIEKSWLEEMSSLGAVIKIYPCDVTKKDDITATFADILSTLPPIAGVAQGAMVLHDMQMREMSFDTFQDATRPKVEGSIHLSNLFSENTLDFFVFFSSISSVIGNFGQSSYAAGNLFMSSLAEQRRQRGLAASVINIGPIMGVGYIAEQDMDITSVRTRFAGVPISEQDFHYLFAESVLAGLPQASKSAEISSGVRQVRLDEKVQPKWSSNPFMSHYLLNREAPDIVSSKSSKVPLKTRLFNARSHGEVYQLVRDAFLEKLGSLFQFDINTMDQDNIDATRLDELGLDSLMATEIRTWLMENIAVNFPVLKILSGICVQELVMTALEDIAQPLIPNVELVFPGPVIAVTEVSDSDSKSATTDSLSISYGADLNSNISELTFDDDTLQLRSAKPIFLTLAELSMAQSMFWLTSTLFEDKTSLNFSGVARVTGPIRKHDFADAVHSLGQQHECFRTCFLISDGKLMQSIMENSTLQLEYRNIIDETEVEQTTREVQEHIYDLERGETVRLILLSLSFTDHFLIIGTTHLSMDGISVQILVRDLFQHYNRQPQIEETLQYQRYVQAQNESVLSGELEKEFRFWKAQYPDFPPSLPILRVSPAISRPSLTTFDHSRISAKISLETKSRIQSVCRKSRVTQFHFYLACFSALLSRYADVEDVSIGIGDANRSEDSMTGIGVFSNVLPLRFRTKLSNSFEEVLQEARTVVLAALENSQVPFQALIKQLDPPRSATCTPIFQCLVNYRPGLGKEIQGDCEIELQSIEVSKTGYDLTLDIIDDPKGESSLGLIVRKDLYQRSEAKILMKSYQKLINAFADEPNALLTKPDLYEREDIQQALTLSQGIPRVSEWPKTVIHRIDDAAKAHPDEVAVQSITGKVSTYSELLKLSGSIATALTRFGVAAGSRIATLQEPSSKWIASMLAIMRIGGVYLPLDLSTPWVRLAAIMKDCKPILVLVDEVTQNLIHELQQPNILSINVSTLDLEQQIPPIMSTTDGQAMILYSSGSSGIPKGIILTHESIRNQVEPTQEIYGLGAEVVLQQSASSFDMAYAQIFTALCFGGSVCPLPRHLRGDARTITDLIVSEGITHTFATPTEYSSWLRYGQTTLLQNSSWQTAICGGEVVSRALLMQFRSLQKTNLRVFNGYGPTETFVVATAMELPYWSPSTGECPNIITAGSVLPNYSVYIVDENLNIVAPGVQGEVYIGGASVAIGYLNDTERTAERFVPDVFATSEFKAKGWTKMHRVGDLGRWREDGTILIEGRIAGDTQIKLRGIRIDLREIEDAIITAAHGSLSEVVVSVRRSSPESPEFLIAHVLLDAASSEERGDNDLQSLLPSLSLPKYMLPAVIIPVQHMPRTSSAKLDRKAISLLPIPEPAKQDEDNWQSELNETELRLRDIWIEVIQIPTNSHHQITPKTDFFHAGGTSLLLLDLQAKVRSLFDTNLPFHHMLESSTLGGMAGLIQKGQAPSQEKIDWEKETAVPQAITELLGSTAVVPTTGRVIVLTGSTGYLGRALLDALIANDNVEKIHCVGIRGVDTRVDMLNLKKTHLYEGDLKMPSLGLSTDDAHEIFMEADFIIHNGAQVSHLQSYYSLRPPNVLSSHELIKMSIRTGRRIPLHFISTAQVGVYYAEGTGRPSFPEVTVANYPPPTDGSGGYAATKWASECFLERLHNFCLQAGGPGWPIFVHRPSLISRQIDKPELDVVHNLRHFSARMGAVPILPHLHGYLDTLPLVALGEVVEGVVSALYKEDASVPGVRYHHYFGHETVSLNDAILNYHNNEEKEVKAVVEQLEPKEWARRAGELGMDRTVIQWVESAERQRVTTVFPEIVRGAREDE